MLPTASWPGYEDIEGYIRNQTWKRKSIFQISDICYRSIKKAKHTHTREKAESNNELVENLSQALIKGVYELKNSLNNFDYNLPAICLENLACNLAHFESLRDETSRTYQSRKTISLQGFLEYLSIQGVQWIHCIRSAWLHKEIVKKIPISLECLSIPHSCQNMKTSKTCILEHSACGEEFPIEILRHIPNDRKIDIITSPHLLKDRFSIWFNACRQFSLQNSCVYKSTSNRQKQTERFRLSSWRSLIECPKSYTSLDIVIIDEIDSWPCVPLQRVITLRCSFVFVGVYLKSALSTLRRIRYVQYWTPAHQKKRLSIVRLPARDRQSKKLNSKKLVDYIFIFDKRLWFGHIVDLVCRAAQYQPNLLKSRWQAVFHAWKYMQQIGNNLDVWSDNVMTCLLHCLCSLLENELIPKNVFDGTSCVNDNHSWTCRNCLRWFGTEATYKRHTCMPPVNKDAMQQILNEAGCENLQNEYLTNNVSDPKNLIDLMSKLISKKRMERNPYMYSLALSCSIASFDEYNAVMIEKLCLEQACQHKGLTLWLTAASSLQILVSNYNTKWFSKTPYLVRKATPNSMEVLESLPFTNQTAFRNLEAHLKLPSNQKTLFHHMWSINALNIRSYLGYELTIAASMSSVWRWSFYTEITEVYISPSFLRTQNALAQLRRLRRLWSAVPFVFQSIPFAPWDNVLDGFIQAYSESLT